jgi:hypothetical protein
MNRIILTALTIVSSILNANAQEITFESKVFELKNVRGSVIQLKGENVLKIERDLKALPFDVKN